MGSSHVASKHRKGLIRPFKGLIRPLKGTRNAKQQPPFCSIRPWPVKGLIRRPFKVLIRLLKGLIRPF